MRKKLRVCKELPLASLGAQDAQALFPLRFGIPDALVQQVARVAVSLHGAGDPQAVDIEIPRRFNGHPGVFCRNVLDKALAPLLTAVKDKPLGKAPFQPLFFHKALFAGHGAADVLLVDVFFRDSDIVHIISTLSFCRSAGRSTFSIRSTPHLKAPARFAGR